MYLPKLCHVYKKLWLVVIPFFSGMPFCKGAAEWIAGLLLTRSFLVSMEHFRNTKPNKYHPLELSDGLVNNLPRFLSISLGRFLALPRTSSETLNKWLNVSELLITLVRCEY